jgi:hypothetical protein
MHSFLLTKNTSPPDRIPSDNLWKTILELNCFGPISGTTSFPDVRKMDLCFQYLKNLFGKHGMLSVCMSYIDQKFCHRTSDVSYPETFLEQMASSYYMVEGDECRFTKHGVDRVTATLHAKSSFAQVFETILKHVLKPIVVSDQKAKIDEDSYHSVAILSDILKAGRGAKDSLEKAVKAWGSNWIMLGHFALGDWDLIINDDVQQDSVLSAQKLLVTLSESMGSVVSYLAWLYGKEAHEDADALADLIHNSLLFAFDQAESKNPPAVKDCDQFLTHIKLRIIGDLDKSVVPQLRPKLAQRLNIAAMYNIIYG